MLKDFLTFIHFDIKLTLRQAYTLLTPLLFFVIVTSLFPIALGHETFNPFAGAIIWIAAVLAIIISIDQLFREDTEQGFLDQLLLSDHPLSLFVIGKILSFWLTHCLPLILISPLLGFLLHLNAREILVLIGTLLLGTPVLTLIGAIGSALTVGLRGHGLLLPVLIIPMYIPVLIFGTGIVTAAQNNLPLIGNFAIMAALLLVTFIFSPLLTTIALRIGVNQS